MQYNPLFAKVFGDVETAISVPSTPILTREFGDEYERLIRETIVDLAKNYRGKDCADRLANLVRALRSLITNPGMRDKFSSKALGYVYNEMPHDSAGAAAELRRWLYDSDPQNWRRDLQRRRAAHEQA